MSEYKNKLYRKKTSWLVINLDYILKNYYYEFKNNFIKKLLEPNKYNINHFDWYKYENDLNFIDIQNDKLILEITNELIADIIKKIQNLVIFHKIQNNNVVFIHEQKDTLEINNWRTEIWSNFRYYNCNNELNDSISNIKIIDTLLDYDSILFNYLEHNYIYITEKNIQANDMISIIIKAIDKTFNYNSITIISNDYVIYQLISDRIHILNVYGEEDTTRMLSSSEVNLWYHIINGYKNYNIPPIMFKASLIYDFIKETNNYHPINKIETLDFRQLNKRELYYVLHHLNDFKKFILNTSDFILNNQYIINKQILDFNNIPLEIYESIKKLFLDISYLKVSSSFYYNNTNSLNIFNKQMTENNHDINKKQSKNINNKKKDDIQYLKLAIKKSNNLFSALTIYDSDES
jgi:hypothetical protein